MNENTTDDLVPYEGKLFETGEYPDKEFSLTEAELDERLACFEGVDLDLEHSEFHDLLGHRLGRLERMWRDGRDALGRLLIPRWLHDLCGGRLQTSLSFDRAKNIVGCALTLSPRIADAQVAAAFAEFSKLAPTNPTPPPATPPIDPIKETFMTKSFKDRLRLLFSRAPEAVAEAGIDPAELDALPTPEPQPNPQPEQKPEPTIMAQLAEFKATNDRLIAGQLHTSATLFADETIRAAKAVPAQREHLIDLYKSAATVDGAGIVRFADNGLISEGANLKALKDLFKDAQPHRLFTAEIPNESPAPEGGEPDPKMVERLRHATSLGKQTIKKEAN